MKFTDPQGRTLNVDSPDGSVPSEAELDQMFSMKYGNVGAPASSNVSAPKESIPQLLGRATSEAWKESGGAILSAANDLTANNIKPNVARLAGQGTADAIFPEQKSLEGKTLRFASGFVVPAAKAVQGLGVLKGGLAVGAAYGAGQDVLNPDTSLKERGTNAALGGGLGLATGSAIKAVPHIIEKGLDLIPRPIKDRIFNLYNYSIGTKIKNLSEANKIKDRVVGQVKTISDNLPNVKFTDYAAQEAGMPLNRADNLEAFQQTKDAIWQKHIVDTKGATEQGVQVNYSKVVDDALAEAKSKIGNKSLGLDANGKRVKGANVSLNNAFEKIAKEQKALKNMTPSEAIGHLKFLNDQIKPLYNSGNAIDFSTKDLLSSIRYKLQEATDDAIENALGKSGFTSQRKQFSDLRAGEKEIVNSANKHARESIGKGGGVTHSIVDLWSLKDLLHSGGHAITGNPTGAAISLGQAAAIKTASKIQDFLRSPDRRIQQMYQLAAKYKVKPNVIIPNPSVGKGTNLSNNKGMLSGEEPIKDVNLLEKELQTYKDKLKMDHVKSDKSAILETRKAILKLKNDINNLKKGSK